MRRLALNDEEAVASVLGARDGVARWSDLDVKSQALSQLAALIALGADAASYDWAVGAALDVGGTEEEIIGVLLAIAPVVGVARLNAAAAALADGLGCDLDMPGET
jgi:alkylhydroperoxidase/carboxymuconolactone decarboxylase family protein YurZ